MIDRNARIAESASPSFPECSVTHNIFVIHENADFMTHFQKALEGNGKKIAPLKSIKALPKESDSPNSVVVIAAEGNWIDELSLLQKMKKDGREFFAIVSSPCLLQKTFPLIGEMTERLNSKDGSGKHPDSAAAAKGGDHKGHEPNLDELVEKKLSDFVRKIKNCEVKKLYGLLIREFEKPLIKLVLKETRGNQVQAAQLLGMNRNTLRKKMKELKIPVVKTKSRQ
ncbi:MAG: helix-turn-helix domain-containing protein [Nitrospiria bacterium]